MDKPTETAASERVDPRIVEIISRQLGVDESEVKLEAKFVDDLSADSLDTVELVMAFEEAYDIQVPDEDVDKIDTVRDAQAYIRKHAKR